MAISVARFGVATDIAIKASSEQVLKMSPTLDWVEPGASVENVQEVYGRHASSSVEHLGSSFFCSQNQRNLLDEVKHLLGTSTSPSTSALRDYLQNMSKTVYKMKL